MQSALISKDSLKIPNKKAQEVIDTINAFIIAHEPGRDIYSRDIYELNNSGDLIHLSISIIGLDVDFLGDIELTELEVLNINGCLISSLQTIAHFSKLKKLDLGGGNLTSLDGIDNFQGLISLNVERSKIESLLPLRKISYLESFSCQLSNVNELEGIEHLSSLTYLNVGGSQIKSLSMISKMTKLTTLLCWTTCITSLSSIEGLTQLTTLAFGNNDIDSLQPLASLNNLQQVSFWGTKISSLDTLSSLSNLIRVDCKGTLVTCLDCLCGLPKLISINAKDCNISFLSEKITSLGLELSINENSHFVFSHKIENENDALKEILLSGNKIISPPLEIINQGNTVVDYYFDSLQGETQQLNEAKLVLVGEGAAGKTSLINRFIDDTFDAKQDKTDGIAIRPWPVSHYDSDIKVHCWDFGGQEIMRATHQIFLSKRCIYLIVLDGRKDENPEQWLKQVLAVSKDSPIFMISNKVDEHYDNNLAEQTLKKKYPQIVGFYRTSCKKNVGIELLQEEIIKEVAKMEMCKFLLAKNWASVKEQIEEWSITKDHISYDIFIELCEKNGVVKKEIQVILLNLLHDLGLVIHFNELLELQTQVLNPSWITEGIYTLLNSDTLSKKHGVINRLEAEKILEEKWNDGRYSNKTQYLMKVMEQFELCYYIQTSLDSKYLIPDLLPTELLISPEIKDGIDFIYQYKGYMPPELMPRFIVKSNEYRVDGKSWRNGVLLSHGILRSQAIITADKEDRTIRIQISDGEQREFLTIIRNYFSEIHNAYQHENIGLEEFLPLTSPMVDKESLLSYRRLVNIEKRIMQNLDRDQQYDEVLDTEYSVTKLLNGIQKPEQRLKQYNMEGVNTVVIENTMTQNASPVITQNNAQENLQNNTQKTSVTISVEIKTLTSSLKNWGEDIIDDLQESPEINQDIELKSLVPRAERELSRVNQSLEDIKTVESEEQAQEHIDKFTRVSDFIKESIDGTNKTGKLLKATGEGVDKVQSLAKQYNKIAQYFALPVVPDILLGGK
ncbi:COR domain-containing protein [Psychromonas sp. Urea-02u-13]|uniref:COR domain-containing protein n=1 Tax=Psychromonas sp. Urea-02u-13 TaxID=2058326 RepID=UPI000C3207DB|nr:COR domain-containing protein [Psychromonas sp. Urea-02u-13]PKG37339.1 hypothetical protein CXF74_19415 [Psychromonas sp. Urea-02u-13]